MRTKEEILEELDRIRRQKREAIKAQIRCVRKMMKLQEELKEVEEHGANYMEIGRAVYEGGAKGEMFK